jgi:hypothetical protein
MWIDSTANENPQTSVAGPSRASRINRSKGSEYEGDVQVGEPSRAPVIHLAVPRPSGSATAIWQRQGGVARLLDTASKTIIKNFFENLAETAVE